MINTKESEEERRRSKSEELKSAGNQAFQNGDYQLAEEYFTSAILQWDQNYVLFNNRALARISQNKVSLVKIIFVQYFSSMLIFSLIAYTLRKCVNM